VRNVNTSDERQIVSRRVARLELIDSFPQELRALELYKNSVYKNYVCYNCSCYNCAHENCVRAYLPRSVCTFSHEATPVQRINVAVDVGGNRPSVFGRRDLEIVRRLFHPSLNRIPPPLQLPLSKTAILPTLSAKNTRILRVDIAHSVGIVIDTFNQKRVA